MPAPTIPSGLVPLQRWVSLLQESFNLFCFYFKYFFHLGHRLIIFLANYFLGLMLKYFCSDESFAVLCLKYYFLLGIGYLLLPSIEIFILYFQKILLFCLLLWLTFAYHWNISFIFQKILTLTCWLTIFLALCWNILAQMNDLLFMFQVLLFTWALATHFRLLLECFFYFQKILTFCLLLWHYFLYEPWLTIFATGPNYFWPRLPGEFMTQVNIWQGGELF